MMTIIVMGHCARVIRSNTPCWSRPTKTRIRNFDFDTYDTYDWYLKAGPLTTLNDKYLHGTLALLERRDASRRL